MFRVTNVTSLIVSSLITKNHHDGTFTAGALSVDLITGMRKAPLQHAC